MRSLLLVSLVFAICYLLSRPVFSTRLSLFGFRHLFLSGLEVLFVGYLFGPRGLDLIPESLGGLLDPLIHLALAWAAFLFGLQFSWRQLKMYPAWRYGLAFAQAAVAGVLAGFGGAWLAARLLPEMTPDVLLRVGWIFGLCAASTSSSSLHYFSRVFRIRGRVDRLLKFVAAVDAIPAVIALGVAGALFSRTPAPGGGESLAGWVSVLLAIALALVLGVAAAWLASLELSRQELVLALLGVLLLAQGASRVIGASTVFVAAMIGALVANLSWHREELHKIAVYAEKPLYLAFLFMAGTLLSVNRLGVLVLALGLVALRAVGKIAGNLPWRWVAHEPRARTGWLGLALVSQGALTIVLVLDIEFLHRGVALPQEVITPAVSAVVLAVLVNELVSPLFIRGVSPREEVGRRPET